MTALSDRLNEAKGDRGLDVIVQIAENKGHKIDRSTFHRAFSGDHAKRPRDETLRAWAAGLDLDVNELRRLCDMPDAGSMGIYQGPDESARLDRDQRKALDQLIKTIVRQKEVPGHVATPAQKKAQPRPIGTAPSKRAPSKVGTRAARKKTGGSSERGKGDEPEPV